MKIYGKHYDEGDITMNRQDFLKTAGALSLGALAPMTLLAEPKKRYNLHTIHLKKGHQPLVETGYRDAYIADDTPRMENGRLVDWEKRFEFIGKKEKALAPTFEISCNPIYHMTDAEWRKNWRDLYGHKNYKLMRKTHEKILHSKGIFKQCEEFADKEEEKTFNSLANLGCKDIFKFIRQERQWLPCSEGHNLSIVYFEEIGVIGLV